jgi:hypothetical protein
LRAILQANPETFLEVNKMRNDTLTLDDVLARLGYTARWEKEGEKRGEKKGKVEVARNMVAGGWPEKEVVETTGLDIKTVKILYRGGRR